MDIPKLASDIANFLAPFLPYLILASEAAAKEAGKKFGEAAWNKAVKLWEKLKPKVEEKPVLKEATEKVARKPEDKRVIDNLEFELEEVFNEDTELAQTIEEIHNSIVIAGDMINSQIAMGDGNTQQSAGDNSVQIGKIEINIEGGVYKGPTPRNPQDALKYYRAVMANMTANLSLSGIDLHASNPKTQRAIGLANVYIDLNTTVQVEREKVKKAKSKEKAKDEQEELLRLLERSGNNIQPLTALNAIIDNRATVIKGDPGSGKSTFVNYVTYCLATQLTDRLENWKKEDADVLPVIVILRDFIKSFKKLPEKSEPKHIWDFIEKRLKDQNLATASKPIQELLEQGKIILFFDGLDEVTSISQRVFVRDAVNAFVKRYDKNRFVVTCRILSYTEPKEENEPDLRLTNFPEFELAPFNEEQIKDFIEHWYKELVHLGSKTFEEASELESNLNTQIRQRPELSKLAENPLLLTVMAVVNTDEGQLPDTRAKLYETVIDKLLWQWEITSKGQDASQLKKLLQEANMADADLKRVIWKLAYEAHAQTNVNDEDDESLTGIPESKLLNSLKTLNKGSLDWAAKVIEIMKLRAGLLLERENGIFTFPHRSFQEFLAGAHLDQDDFVTQAKELADNQFLWRQVILWAVSRKVFLRGANDAPLALVAELCPKRELKEEKEWSRVWLAGDILLEIGTNRAELSELGTELVPRVQNKLVELIEGNHLTPRERAEAGNVLAQLGDPRIGVVPLSHMGEGLGVRDLNLLFCEIPAGKFLMGSKEGEEDSYDTERPQFEYTIPNNYFMSRYPVTNAQFEAFVKAEDGYTNKKWWTEAGLEWRKDRKEHYRYGGVFALANHPVVGVSWYEATAFCKWLTVQLQEMSDAIRVYNPDTKTIQADENLKSKIVNRKMEIRLPSEAEWERAAHGGKHTLFPWGDEVTPNHANYSDTNLNVTNAVGAFPLGENDFGLLDMSGNVWEWCATEWQENYNHYLNKENNKPEGNSVRVLRGGSYGGEVGALRCAWRYRSIPYFEYFNVGFRVVCVSSSISP